jgi:hypothetical protein
MTPQVNILVAALFVGAAAIYGLIHWIQSAQVRPDPWPESSQPPGESAEELTVCPRCLTPHSTDRDFCETCGLPVGVCTNLSPYLYLFSVGDGLRTGAFGKFPIRVSTLLGYVLVPLCVLGPLVLIYWPFFLYRVFRNIDRMVTGPTPAQA